VSTRGKSRSGHPRGAGFSLIELLLALTLTSLLILGLVQISSAASAAGSLQRNQAQIQEHARFATALLSRAIRQAGFRPEPWNEALTSAALTTESSDGAGAASDRLAVRSWSDLNCFGNRNPDLDQAGQPLFYVRESVFDLGGGDSLTRICRYGPDAARLITQVRRQGVVQGIESFQVLYGEDVDLDGHVERWVRAGQWSDPGRVRGIRIGLLLVSENPVADQQTRPVSDALNILDATIRPPADGRLRQVLDFTVALRGRTG
jgi:type IV pilus assembly protein PilW